MFGKRAVLHNTQTATNSDTVFQPLPATDEVHILAAPRLKVLSSDLEDQRAPRAITPPKTPKGLPVRQKDSVFSMVDMQRHPTVGRHFLFKDGELPFRLLA